MWKIAMRGRKPRWIACRVREKAPVMTAWLAMIVAKVARMTTGSSAHFGNIRKNGSDIASGFFRMNAP
ncbi:hypothetical protein D3C78_1492650 [compost metagenome]